LELGMVSGEVLKLDLVGRGKIANPLDVFLLTVVAVATELVAGDKHHAEPGEARRPVQLQDINRLWDTPTTAGVLD
jgi:hypothetical protein